MVAQQSEELDTMRQQLASEHAAHAELRKRHDLQRKELEKAKAQAAQAQQQAARLQQQVQAGCSTGAAEPVPMGALTKLEKAKKELESQLQREKTERRKHEAAAASSQEEVTRLRAALAQATAGQQQGSQGGLDQGKQLQIMQQRMDSLTVQLAEAKEAAKQSEMKAARAEAEASQHQRTAANANKEKAQLLRELREARAGSTSGLGSGHASQPQASAEVAGLQVTGTRAAVRL